MLVNHNASIDAQDVEGFDKINLGTPLHHAAGNGHLSVVEYLINQNAEINAKNYYIIISSSSPHLFMKLLLWAILVLLNV